MIRLGAVNRIKRLPRYREVANILIKHGFGSLFDRFSLHLLRRKERGPVDREFSGYSAAIRLRRAFEELGPTYVKLGQILSTRPDIFPASYISELEKLQDSVPPIPLERVLEVLNRQGIKMEETFTSFTETSIAAASIGQVHEAVLKSGQRVVVKIQRPGIEKIVENDLIILMEMARLLEKRSDFGRLYKITEIVDELGQALVNELDFRKEARHADNFHRNFVGDKHVVIPRIFWELSSQRVLVMEFVESIKISDFESLRESNCDKKEIAVHLIEALFKQVYEFGLFHADPHPGNIGVLPGEQIVFYDFGQVGILDELMKERCMNLTVNMMRYDAEGVTRSLLEIGVGAQYVNYEEFRRDVARLQQKYVGLPLSEIDIAQSLSELLDLSAYYQLRLPAELSLLVKMMMTVENIVSELDPKLSILDIAKPYGRKLLRRKFSRDRIQRQLLNTTVDYLELAKDFPRQMNNILQAMEDGKFRIKLEHDNINKLTNRLDVISNRISLAIILAALIVGTSLVVKQMGAGFLSRIPLAEAGFALGIVLGLFLAYSIIRSGRY